jgi:N-acetylglutamate synthase-like GNAT family acetyltransferase
MDRWRPGAPVAASPGSAVHARDPYQPDPDVGRLRHVYVDAALRSRGIGERLVRACLDRTGAHFRIIRLKTINPAAARLYERSGFGAVAAERMTHCLVTGRRTGCAETPRRGSIATAGEKGQARTRFCSRHSPILN